MKRIFGFISLSLTLISSSAFAISKASPDLMKPGKPRIQGDQLLDQKSPFGSPDEPREEAPGVAIVPMTIEQAIELVPLIQPKTIFEALKTIPDSEKKRAFILRAKAKCADRKKETEKVTNASYIDVGGADMPLNAESDQIFWMKSKSKDQWLAVQPVLVSHMDEDGQILAPSTMHLVIQVSSGTKPPKSELLTGEFPLYVTDITKATLDALTTAFQLYSVNSRRVVDESKKGKNSNTETDPRLSASLTYEISDGALTIDFSSIGQSKKATLIPDWKHLKDQRPATIKSFDQSSHKDEAPQLKEIMEAMDYLIGQCDQMLKESH